MQKWEYIKLEMSVFQGEGDIFINSIRVLSDVTVVDFYKYLNKLGNEGWEIIDYWRSECQPPQFSTKWK